MIDSNFFKQKKGFLLSEIYDLLGIPFNQKSAEDPVFTQVGTLLEADPQTITVLHNAKYAKDAQETKAGLCLTTPDHAHYVNSNTHVLCHDKPYRAFAMIAKAMYGTCLPTESFIHATADIDPTAKLGPNCHIGPYVAIGKHVQIGANTVIKGHCQIDDHVTIGEKGFIDHHVTISHAIIGHQVLIKPGTRIGQQGFGFHMDEKGHFDVPQLGIVEIGNDVQIGANVCIDRGSLQNTVICDGVRIDNLVQIAHNVYIGARSVIVAQVGIAGSTKVGRGVVLAGQVGVAGHLTIGDHVKVAAQSGLMRDIKTGETVAGSPSMPIRDWHKQTILLKKMIKDM